MFIALYSSNPYKAAYVRRSRDLNKVHNHNKSFVCVCEGCMGEGKGGGKLWVSWVDRPITGVFYIMWILYLHKICGNIYGEVFGEVLYRLSFDSIHFMSVAWTYQFCSWCATWLCLLYDYVYSYMYTIYLNSCPYFKLWLNISITLSTLQYYSIFDYIKDIPGKFLSDSLRFYFYYIKEFL